MNPRILTREEKWDFRRLRNRRRHLKKLRKQHARLRLALISSPKIFALLQADAIEPARAFDMAFGRIDRARRAACEAMMAVTTQETLPSHLSHSSANGDNIVPFPERRLRPDRCGNPQSVVAFRETFLMGVHVARFLRQCGRLCNAPLDAAYMKHTDVIELMPGIVMPKHLRRCGYLLRITVDRQARTARLAAFSVRLAPLIWQPLALSFAEAIYDGENEPVRSADGL